MKCSDDTAFWANEPKLDTIGLNDGTIIWGNEPQLDQLSFYFPEFSMKQTDVILQPKSNQIKKMCKTKKQKCFTT